MRSMEQTDSEPRNDNGQPVAYPCRWFASRYWDSSKPANEPAGDSACGQVHGLWE